MTTIETINPAVSHTIHRADPHFEFGASCFEFVSDFDIRISCFLSIYAKQTQFRIPARRQSANNRRDFSKKFQIFPNFSKNFSLSPPAQTTYAAQITTKPRLFMQNKPNFPDAKMNLTTYSHKDYQNIHPRSPLQNKPDQLHRPPTTQPTIKMQNKPNFQNTKINVTAYEQMVYINIHLCEPRKIKPNLGSRRAEKTSSFFSGTFVYGSCIIALGRKTEQKSWGSSLGTAAGNGWSRKSAMIAVASKPGTNEKLEILSQDAQYDLACACNTSDQGRKRGEAGKWIYPITLPNGGKSVLFKTLMSNVCTSDCKYCPLRQQQDLRRCSLQPEETAEVFLDYYKRRKVFGLFLSSGIIGTPDATMDRLNSTAQILRRKHGFRGYIHLKIIPGASDAAIEQAVSLASAVSLNIETPGANNLARLSSRKNYLRDIIEPIKLISRLTAKGSRHEKVKQTTQFIVGPAGETDAEIVKYTYGLYERLKMQRVYFSAYQNGLGDQSLLPPDQPGPQKPSNIFVREHRLYQVDFLLRRYRFAEGDIVFERDGSLSLDVDPKQAWADANPERFPVNTNSAGYYELLRVPGLGHVTVKSILNRRKQSRLRSIDDIGKVGVRLTKADKYLVY